MLVDELNIDETNIFIAQLGKNTMKPVTQSLGSIRYPKFRIKTV